MKAQFLTRETIRSLGTVERNFPTLAIGDFIAVSQRIVEGDKERLQLFEGHVIAIHNNGASSTFTVRKIAAGAVAVERIFPFHSPVLESVKVLRKGDVRRAKLYYMRNRIGSAAMVKEIVKTRAQREQQEASHGPVV